jgi:hypothetical protein
MTQRKLIDADGNIPENVDETGSFSPAIAYVLNAFTNVLAFKISIADPSFQFGSPSKPLTRVIWSPYSSCENIYSRAIRVIDVPVLLLRHANGG